MCIGIVVRPDDHLLRTGSTTADPDFFFEVEFQHLEAAAGEQEVMDVQESEKCFVSAQVHFQGPCAVSVVRQEVVAGLEVIAGPGGIPPAGGDTDLRILTLNHRVEGGALHLLPVIRRDDGDLLARLEAFTGVAIDAVPVGGIVLFRIVNHPDVSLLHLPMSCGSIVILEGRHGNLLAVDGIQLACEGVDQDILGNGDHDGAGALAVEQFVIDKERFAVLVHEFYAVDELQVLAEDGKLLPAFDALAFLSVIAGNDRFAKGQLLRGLHLFVCGADDELATFGGDARGCIHPDHIVADDLEVGDSHAAGEYDLRHVQEAGTIDGHRLSGDHLRREEHLDAQSEIRGFDDRIQDVACREGAHQGD